MAGLRGSSVALKVGLGLGTLLGTRSRLSLRGAWAPTTLGARAALAKGAEVLAYAWAGSQVTKVARAPCGRGRARAGR